MVSRRAILAVAAWSVALGASASAGAATQRVVPLTVAGATCDAVGSATYQLPAAARLASVRSPIVGDWVGGTKADAYSRDALGRVTGVDIRGRMLTVTIAADPAGCLGSALPGEPVDAPWIAAVDVDLSYLVPDLRWARRETRALAQAQLHPAYADEVRTRCRRADPARFSCVFGSFAGDAVVSGRGTVWIGRDDEWAHYAFRVETLDEYCHFVLRRPLRACRTIDRWRG